MNNSNSDHVPIATQNPDSIKTNEMSLSKDEKESAKLNPDLKPVTKTIQKGTNLKRNYVNTTNEQRLELIEAVCKHGERVKSAAHRLRINYSAAKAICQIYKSEGRCAKKLPRRRPPTAYKINDKSLFMSSDDNADPLKVVPITLKKEYVDEKEAIRPFITEKTLQLMKNPWVQYFPQVQVPLNQLNSLKIPQQLFQSQNLLQNSGIHIGSPSPAQQSLNRLTIIGVPVISSQVCTSNIFIMLPPQTNIIPSQPTVNVNRFSVLTHPLSHTQCNNPQLSSFSSSIPSHRFLF